MSGVDAQTLADLVDRHSAALGLFASQWCHAPDDVVQQAYIELVACRPAPDNPVAWLFAAVRRRAISRSRAERSRQGHEATAARQWFERFARARKDGGPGGGAVGRIAAGRPRDCDCLRLWPT